MDDMNLSITRSLGYKYLTSTASKAIVVFAKKNILYLKIGDNAAAKMIKIQSDL